MRPRILSIAVAGSLLLPLSVQGQTIQKAERALLPYKFTLSSKDTQEFWSALKVLREEEDRQYGAKGSIGVGFNGDQTGLDNQSKLKASAEFKRGSYPSELRFTTDVSVQVKNGEFQEDVTSLLVNYDYHYKPWSEYYVFMERFTDDFLSIHQRYEVGFGAMFGKSFGLLGKGYDALEALDAPDVRTKGRKGVTALELFDAATKTMTAAVEAELKANPKADLSTDLLGKDFRKAASNLRQAIIDRKSKVVLGTAISFFSETERANIESEIVSSAPGSTTVLEKKVFDIPGTQRYRMTLRPTVILRPSDDLSLTFYPYFKLPLNGPIYVDVNGKRRLDYRRDIKATVDWTLKDDETGGQDVGIAFNFAHYFDNSPPSIPTSVVASELAAGRVIKRTTAERAHRAISMELKISWGE